MERSHTMQAMTLALAALAAVFSFVAMQAAREARTEARTAGELASMADDGAGQDVWRLHEALVRAGVVEDPEGMFPPP